MHIEELMSTDVVVCRSQDALNHAAQLMWEKDCGFIPVVDDAGSTVAVLTDRDICMAAYTQGKPLSEIPVEWAMSKTLVSCRPDETVGTAEALMRARQIRRLPVIAKDGKLVGVLSLNDIATHGIGRKAHVRHNDLGAEAIAATLGAICTHTNSAPAAAE